MKDFFHAGRNVLVLAVLIMFSIWTVAVLAIKESKTEYVMGLIQLSGTLAGILGGLMVPREGARRADNENVQIDRTTTVHENAVTTIPGEKE